MLIKICGITTVEDALQAVQAGADALGFNFYPMSPRCLTVQQAEAILDRLPASILKVAVIVVGKGMPPTRLPAGIDVIQVHGAQGPRDLPQSSKPLWAAVTIESAAQFPDHEIVIDPSWGSGKKADWDELPRRVQRPYALSGGLTPDNLSDALSQLDPWGVDVCSGVESAPGRKDHAKVTRFIQVARTSRPTAKTPL